MFRSRNPGCAKLKAIESTIELNGTTDRPLQSTLFSHKARFRRTLLPCLLGSAFSILTATAFGQTTYNYTGAIGSSWIRSGNWTGGTAGKSPGVDNNPNTTVDGATTDIASFSTSSTLSSLGINFNSGTGNGSTANGAANTALSLGAITLSSGGTAGNFLIGNNSTSLDGLLTLNGVTVNSVSNVILRNASANSLTLANVQGSGNKLMGVVLGNATENVISIDGTGSIELSSVVSGANRNLTLNASGSGSLVLSGGNTFSGTTVLNSGVINIRNATALGSTTAGTSVATGAAIQIQGGISVGAEALTLNGAGVGNTGAFRNISGVNTYGGLVTLGSSSQINSDAGTITLSNTGTITGSGFSLTVGGAGNTSIASIIGTGSGGLTKVDGGTLTLGGVNTYSGGTTVNGGALVVSSSGSLASGSALTVSSSGTADFANAGQTLGAVSNANAATNALNFSANTGTVTLASLTGAGNTRFGSNGVVTGGISNGTVTSVGTLNADISGTANITAGGLLTGAITGGTVSAGSLSSTSVTGGSNNVTGAASVTTLNGGVTTVGGVATVGTMTSGTANLNGASSSIATLNGGTVNLGTTVLTVDSGSMAGSITGSNGSLVKSSAGTLTLSGDNSYSGATNVTAGKLVVNGNNSAATGTLTVGSGATLGGSGTIGGATIINGVHSPGNSPGLQTFAGGLTYNTGSSLTWELIGNALGVRGVDFDAIDVTGGTLTINPGVTSDLVFNGAGSTVNWSNSFWDNDQQWLVFDNANAPSLSLGSIFGTVTVSADSASQSFSSIRSGASFSWSQTGNDIFLNYHSVITAVPEPSSLALVGVVFASAAFARRRKQSV